jgi:hypothetical protein
MTYRVFNRLFEAYHNPSNRKGVTSTRDGAATWAYRAEAEAVANELNERDRDPEDGDRGEDDWIVVDDREPPRVVRPAVGLRPRHRRT